MRGLARIYDVRMAQFVLKIEKLSHIMGPRASQDLRSPSPIMASDYALDSRTPRVPIFLAFIRIISNSKSLDSVQRAFSMVTFIFDKKGGFSIISMTFNVGDK